MENTTIEETAFSNASISVGSFFILLTLTFFLPYVYAMYWMIRDPRLDRKSFQRIMIGLGFVDLVQLIINGFTGGAFIISGTYPSYWVSKTLGGLLNSSFIIHSSLATLLAFNRFVVMCLRPEYRHSVFNRKRTDLLIGFCYLYGLCFLIAYLCPDIDIVLHIDLYSWHYSMSPGSVAVFYVEMVQDFTQIAIMIVFYTAVVVKMKVLMAGMTAPAFVGQRASSSANREIGVSIQATLISAVVIVGLILWFTAPQVAANKWSFMIANCFWLATAGTNAWIYFIFNKRLRHHAVYYTCHLWKKGTPVELDESAYSSSNCGNHKNRRTIALMGYGAACMVGRPASRPEALPQGNTVILKCNGRANVSPNLHNSRRA